MYGLIFAAIAITGTVTLALHTARITPPTKQTHDTATPPKASPAQLAADKAAYKASADLAKKLQTAYDQAQQAEQAALDQYGDTSPQYQTAKNTANSAKNALDNQWADTLRKSLQVTIDSGDANN